MHQATEAPLVGKWTLKDFTQKLLIIEKADRKILKVLSVDASIYIRNT